MTGWDDPFADMPGGGRVDHVVVDEQQQMQKYLAEIAMEDLRLLPDPSRRRVRPGSLMAQYQESVKAAHALEAANEVAPIEEIVLMEVRTSVPSAGVAPPDDKVAKGFGET